MENVQLWLHLREAWLSVLTIPINELSHFSIRPLKWLRYVGFTIYGREGVLLFTTEEGDEVDYDLTTDFKAHYYFSSPRQLFLYFVSNNR